MKEMSEQEKARYNDVHKVLMNNLVLTEDRRLAPGPDHRLTLWGVGDGAKETMVFGVKTTRIRMEHDYSNHRQAIYQGGEAMRNIGRRLALESAPDGEAVLIRHVFFRPVVLILEEEDGQTVINAYCGRAIWAWPSVLHALYVFEKACDNRIHRYRAPKEET